MVQALPSHSISFDLCLLVIRNLKVMDHLDCEVPLQVRRLVREFMLEKRPSCLIPIEIMEGIHVSKLGIAETVGSSDSNFKMPQPLFTKSFAAAVCILERALNIVKTSQGISSPQHRQHHTDPRQHNTQRELDAQNPNVQAIATQLHRLNESSSEQVFYIAGDFVVGFILQYKRWQHIEVFFAPHWNEKEQSWTFISGAPGHPVNIAMVNDPLLYIETFDLDISKCAIKCLYANGKRYYQFMLSLSCARAILLNHSITRKIHASWSGQPRLARRLQEYRMHGFLPLYDQVHALSKNENHIFFNGNPFGLEYFLSRLPSQRIAAYWIFGIKENKIAYLDFHFGDAVQKLQDQNQKDLLIQCEPFILYPCKKGLSTLSYQKAIASRNELHWLKRAFFYVLKYKMLVFLGNHRVCSSMIMPTWLLDHVDLNEKDIISLVKAT